MRGAGGCVGAGAARSSGFGLTSALYTSPAAYLGSMAAVSSAPAFAPYTSPDCPLPLASLAHGWIKGSMDAITDASPECKKMLPAQASAFFQHFPPRSSSSSLQHELSLQATHSVFTASLQRAKEMKKEDGGLTLARLVSVSAPRAWTWKVVAPTSSELSLSDVEYRLAVRFNLGLQPMAGAAAMPDVCSLCKAARTHLNSIRDEPWHFLSCPKLKRGELNIRHDEVSRAIYRSALLMGLRAQHEVEGLDATGDLRPDVLLTLPGRQVLTDVAIVHPLAHGAVREGRGLRQLGCARGMEAKKRRKYAQMSSLRGFEQLPFVVETSGGMGPSADTLVKAMAEASEEYLRIWSKAAVIRHLVGSVAVAVQRGSAISYLDGYDKSLQAMRKKTARRVQEDHEGEGEEEVGREEEEEGEGGEEGELAAAA